MLTEIDMGICPNRSKCCETIPKITKYTVIRMQTAKQKEKNQQHAQSNAAQQLRSMYELS